MSYVRCERCGGRKWHSDDHCNDCEVALIHCYDNNRRAGKSHEQAMSICWPSNTEKDNGRRS